MSEAEQMQGEQEKAGPLPFPDASVAPPPYEPEAEQEAPKCLLSYVDFLPGTAGTTPEGLPEFQEFDTLIDQANAWLSENPHMEPISCETVERLIEEVGAFREKKSKIDMQCMGFNEQPFEDTNIYLMGLRMWVRSREDPYQPPVQIGFRDFTPGKAPSQGQGPGQTRQRNFPNLEGAASIIAKMNSSFSSNPVPGYVLNIQTVEVRVGQAWNDGFFLVNRGSWITEQHKPQMRMHFMRLFFIQGPPSKANIGMLDFAPKMIRRPNGEADPVFEKMADLTKKVNTWIQQNPARKVVSFQTIDTRHQKMFWINTSSMTVKLNSDLADVEQSENHRWDRVLRVIRIIFVNNGGQMNPGGPPPEPINCQLKTYPPLGTGRSFEQLVKTTARLQGYVATNPDARVLYAETVLMDYKAGANHGSEIDLAMSRLDPAKRIFYFCAIRLYVSAPNQLLKPKQSSSCAVL